VWAVAPAASGGGDEARHLVNAAHEAWHLVNAAHGGGALFSSNCPPPPCREAATAV
jgi:hypothetical protein